MIDLDGRPGAPVPRSRRRWAAGPLLVAVLLLLAGGQPAADLGPTLVRPADGETADDFAIDGSVLYALSPAALTAYRLPGGGRRWTVPATGGTQLLAAEAARVITAVDDPAGLWASVLTGLDAASGTTVWRRTGYVPVVYGCACAAGTVVTEQYPAGGDPEQERQRSTPSLAGIDIRTGDVRWTLVTPPGGRRSIGFDAAGHARIALLDAAGTLRLYRSDTAEAERTVALQDPGRIDDLNISGDRVLAVRAGRGTILDGTVFDLVTGRRLWHRTAAPDGELLNWCGPAICARTGDGPTAVLDPDTGRERWRLEDRVTLDALPGGRMLATPAAGDGPIRILDAVTGRTVRRIDGWTALGGPADGRLLAGSDTLIARLDLGTGGVRVLGRAPHRPAPPQCRATGRWLACRLDQNRTAVWRLPP